VTIRVSATDVFTPTSLEIPAASTNPGVLIDSIRIGSNDQILGPLPAPLFSEVATDKELDMDTLSANQDIVIVVRNTNAQPVTFEGAFDGYLMKC
jgi:hypothetical protein